MWPKTWLEEAWKHSQCVNGVLWYFAYYMEYTNCLSDDTYYIVDTNEGLCVYKWKMFWFAYWGAIKKHVSEYAS